MSLRRIVAVSKEAEVQQLARQVGQEIFVADNLDEALDIVETVNPDLILFDHCYHPTGIHEFLNMADKNSINVPVVVVGDDFNFLWDRPIICPICYSQRGIKICDNFIGHFSKTKKAKVTARRRRFL
ncbi:hypothetical protein ES703_120497 [subsurface metagenome]